MTIVLAIISISLNIFRILPKHIGGFFLPYLGLYVVCVPYFDQGIVCENSVLLFFFFLSELSQPLSDWPHPLPNLIAGEKWKLGAKKPVAASIPV